MSPYLELNPDERFIPEYFNDGQEVQLTVKSSKIEPEKEGGERLLLVLDPKDKTHDDVYFRTTLPTAELKAKDSKAFGKAVDRVCTLCDGFGIDSSGFDPEKDFLGLTAWFVLRFKDDPEYGKQNSIKRIVIKK